MAGSKVAASQPTAKTERNRRKRARRRQRLATIREEVGNMVVPAELDTNLRSSVLRVRSGPNPADPRSYNSLLQMGNTEPGRCSAIKILHPNGESDAYVAKIPDGYATTSVVMERRDEFDLVPPVDALATDTWNVIVVDAPFLVGTQFAVRYNTDAAPTEAQIASALYTVMASPGAPANKYPAWVAVGGGNPVEYTVLQSASMTPTIANTTQGPSLLFKSIRRTYLGSTFDLNAPDLSNQGRVVCGQWTPDVALTVSTNDTPPPATVSVYEIQVPAFTETQIVASDELCYQAEAKRGLYLPDRMYTDVDFASSMEFRNIVPVTVGAPTLEGVTQTDAGNDIWLRGWLIGVSHWTGLSLSATLRIKRKEGLEFIAAPTSVYSPFGTPALSADARAIAMIREFSRRQPHAFEALDNELGKLLQKILSGVGGAISNLGLPFISPVAGGIGKLASSKVGDSLASLLDDFFGV
jgi:hypothetical protein